MPDKHKKISGCPILTIPLISVILRKNQIITVRNHPVQKNYGLKAERGPCASVPFLRCADGATRKGYKGMNESLFVGSVLLFLGSALLLFKLFGKNGLYCFVVFSTLLCNIQVIKFIDLFGFSTTAGNVLFAASYLVTDILGERYGKQAAARAVRYGLTVMVLWILGTQVTLHFVPDAHDFADPALHTVFGLVPRIALASFIAYACSQSVDVFLYHYIWQRTGGNERKLWVRNNCSTLISQAIDTLIFTSLAFWGSVPLQVFISIMLTTYFFKAIVALADTPFMYLARRIRPIDED